MTTRYCAESTNLRKEASCNSGIRIPVDNAFAKKDWPLYEATACSPGDGKSAFNFALLALFVLVPFFQLFMNLATANQNSNAPLKIRMSPNASSAPRPGDGGKDGGYPGGGGGSSNDAMKGRGKGRGGRVGRVPFFLRALACICTRCHGEKKGRACSKSFVGRTERTERTERTVWTSERTR